MLCFTCTFSTSCLQYASVLQAGSIFQAITWLHFLYPPTKGNVPVSKCDNTHIHNTQYRATAHFMHVRQLLSASCSIIAWQCIIYYSVGFPPQKEMALLQKCNQIWSEICNYFGLYKAWNGNSYHHCPTSPLKIKPEVWPEISVANWRYKMCNILECI